MVFPEPMSGIATCTQFDPSQRIENISSGPDELMRPTAVQSVRDAHETSSTVTFEPLGDGVDETIHVPPVASATPDCANQVSDAARAKLSAGATRRRIVFIPQG